MAVFKTWWLSVQREVGTGQYLKNISNAPTANGIELAATARARTSSTRYEIDIVKNSARLVAE
jgi:hypothetical protein